MNSEAVSLTDRRQIMRRVARACKPCASLFVFFNVFAVNMVLQYKKVGPWRDYLFGEKVYIILSLTAKALLAWQVCSTTLAG
jgi:hypothetical protein